MANTVKHKAGKKPSEIIWVLKFHYVWMGTNENVVWLTSYCEWNDTFLDLHIKSLWYNWPVGKNSEWASAGWSNSTS